MTTYALLPNFGAGAQFFDDSGDPLSGGLLYSYLAGSTTPENTWTSYTGGTLNANPIVLDAAGRVVEEIWIDVSKQYKFVLKSSTFVQIWSKDYVGVYVPAPYVPPPDVDQPPEFITVWDFLSDAQILDVKNRAYTVDCSTEIQLAIDYVAAQLTTYSSRPIGTLFFPAGGYRIEKPLVIGVPIYLQGAGQGGVFNPAQTELRWYGAAADFVKFGTVGDGTPFAGGGIRQMRLTGRAIATRCLIIRGATQFEFSDLYLDGSTVGALELANPGDQPYPTGFGCFRNIYIDQYFTAADGIRIVASSSTTAPQTPAGTPACLWEQIGIQHTNGSGVYINGGDNHQWNRLTVFSSSGAKPGIYFAEAFIPGAGPPFNNTSSAHTFINCAASAGVQVDSASDVNDAIVFVNFDDGDLFPGVTAFYGNGVNRVNATTHSGRLYGAFKTISYKDTINHDSMNFLTYVAPKLTTRNGTWLADANAVTDVAAAGGGILIETTAGAGNIATLYDCATMGSSGVLQANNPHLTFTVVPYDVTNVVHRWGFADSKTNPPLNGIWVELNPATHATYYRMVCMNAGTPTYLDQAINNYAAFQVLQWRIEFGIGVASFYVREAPALFFRYVGTMTTGLPLTTIKMDVFFQVVAVDAAVHKLNILDVKKGFFTEQ
jgi:hypothetical protein